MISYSNKFNTAIMNDNRRYLITLEVQLAENQPMLTLTNSDIWENTFSIEDATSQPNRFTVGSAVTSKMCVTINNIYDKFSTYNFKDATIKARVGLEIEDGIIESRYVGTFVVDEANYNGSTIALTCLDYMHRFDRAYKDVKEVVYPTSLYQILTELCTKCNVNLRSSTNLPKANYVVTTDPTDDNLTCASMIAYIAQINCCYAKVDTNGELFFDWYDKTALSTGLDGGTFQYDGKTSIGNPESQADGGSFSKHFVQYVDDEGKTQYRYADGYTPAEEEVKFGQEKYHVISNLKSFTVATDDSVVTGVRVTDKPAITEWIDEDNNSHEIPPETAFKGNEGYVIEISENPLIQHGNANEVADYLAECLIGTRFRVLSASVLSDPSIEAGDVAIVVDNKGNTFQTFISTRKFVAGSTGTIACDSETPMKNSQAIFSAQAEAYLKAKSLVEKERSAREVAMNAFNVALANSSGLYTWIDKDDTGAAIYYLKDKNDEPTEKQNVVLDDGTVVRRWVFPKSQLVWQMSTAGIAISNDGGRTYPYGLSSFGQALLETVYAVGISADHIQGGTLKLGGYNNIDGKLEIFDSTISIEEVAEQNLNKCALTENMKSYDTFAITPEGTKELDESIFNLIDIPKELFLDNTYLHIGADIKASEVDNPYNLKFALCIEAENKKYNVMFLNSGSFTANGTFMRYTQTLEISEIMELLDKDITSFKVSLVNTDTSKTITITDLSFKDTMIELSKQATASGYSTPYILQNGCKYSDFVNHSAEQIGKWDNNGIYVNKGTIEGTEIIGSNVITYKSNAYEGMATKSVNDGQDITVYKGNNADYKKSTSWEMIFQISQNEQLHYDSGSYDTGIRIKAPAIGFQADSLYVSPKFSSNVGSRAIQGRKEIKFKYGDEDGGEEYHEVKLVFQNGILVAAY